jgi:hypothetical protein
MATIKIQRKNEYINLLREYRLLIDGQKIGTIANGQLKEFELPSGQHTIIAKIDWCSSKEITFDLNDNDLKIFLVGGFLRRKWLNLLWSGLLIISLTLVFHQIITFPLS